MNKDLLSAAQLDPRVHIELENLNTATDEINRLEAALEEVNVAFRNMLTDSTGHLQLLSKKLGSCIEKARPYYEAVEQSRKVHLECQRAAVQFQRACALHQAAKETIALAEERFVNCQDKVASFDSAWQEMLNHATIKVMEAEAQKAASEREHQKRATAYADAEKTVQHLQKNLKSSINRSQLYFEQKTYFHSGLERQKSRIHQLQRDVAAAKTFYAKALHNLECISEEIHETRKCHLPREPGVGAELTPPNDLLQNREEKSSKEEFYKNLQERLQAVKCEVAQDKCNHLLSPQIDLDSLEIRPNSVSGSSSPFSLKSDDELVSSQTFLADDFHSYIVKNADNNSTAIIKNEKEFEVLQKSQGLQSTDSILHKNHISFSLPSIPDKIDEDTNLNHSVSLTSLNVDYI